MPLAFVFALLSTTGCSGDDGTPGDTGPPNHAPVIDFTVPRATPRSTLTVPRRVTLTVGVSDEDGDPVSVRWRITRNGQPSGILKESQQGQPSIEWETPVEVGRDSIFVTASDGRDSAVVKETIQVGTLKSQRIQAAPETWTTADSPYILSPVSGDFVIDEKMTLTIEAGTELYIDKRDIGISVVGTLEINGTAGSPVVIRPNWRVAKPGDWMGITANPSGSEAPLIDFSYAHVLDAVDAVKANTPAAVVLRGCQISRSRDNAVLHGSRGELRVEDCDIINNFRSGIKILKLPMPLPDTVVISGNRIVTNGDVTGETPYAEDAAIYIEIPDTNATSAITISGNEIRDNGVPGIHLVRCCYPLINGNAIYANEKGKAGTSYNIKLESSFGVGGPRDTIDATMNFWGGYYSPAEGDSLIKDMIRDSDDDTSIRVRVTINPWQDTWLSN